MFAFSWNLFFFILSIGILVSVHECGHFFMARLFGVKVERFSIGFGKVLFRKKDSKGTEFAVSLIPLGGYVKMLDARNGNVSQEESHLAFNNQTFLAKFLIIGAGPITNLFLAIVLYTVVFAGGITTLKPIIESINSNSILSKYEIQNDSIINEIDGKSILTWEDVVVELVDKQKKANVSVITTNVSTGHQQQVLLDLSKWELKSTQEDLFLSLGINIKQPEFSNTIMQVSDDSPAQKAGFKVGDVLVGLNGKKLNWLNFTHEVRDNPNKKVIVSIKRNTEELEIPILLSEKNGKGFIGIATDYTVESKQLFSTIQYGLADSFMHAIAKVKNLSVLIIKFIGKLIMGDISLNNLSGPISIAKGAGGSAQIGLIYYLSFLALISVNLGIMNILPLPVLDGGHLFFLLIEGLTGKEVQQRLQEIFYMVGLFLLLFLTIVSIFYDIVR